MLRRFEDRFGLPESVTASVHGGVLALSGEASHVWLARVRKDGTELPGIASIDETQIADADEVAFRHSKTALEKVTVHFAAASVDLSSEGFAILSRVANGNSPMTT